MAVFIRKWLFFLGLRLDAERLDAETWMPTHPSGQAAGVYRQWRLKRSV
jgi:hypothetical protein